MPRDHFEQADFPVLTRFDESIGDLVINVRQGRLSGPLDDKQTHQPSAGPWRRIAANSQSELAAPQQNSPTVEITRLHWQRSSSAHATQSQGLTRVLGSKLMNFEETA